MLEQAGAEIVAQVGDAEALLEILEQIQPDVVITDIKMPPTHTDEGLRAAESIRRKHPEVGVLVLSQYVEPRYALDLMNAGGGFGYLLKDSVDIGELSEALERVAAGESVVDPTVVRTLLDRKREEDLVQTLSDREREILSLMAEGRTNRAICEALFLSPKTVESHVGNIFTKLGLIQAPEDHRRVLAVLTYLRS